jgi:tetratricopeptide (TPR) repeat protein
MLDLIDGVVRGVARFATSLTAAVIVVLGLLVVVRRVKGRKQILFDPWDDLRPQPNETLGRSVGAMLLHRLGMIQSVHERSVKQVEISNTYRDIPIFSHGLDEDIEMLGSAQLGSTPGAITALFVLILRAFPFLSPPTRLKGSIHFYGNCHRLQATLLNYRHPVTHARTTRRWEVVSEGAEDLWTTEAIDELAHRIYLDMLRDEAFKSWECFREFTLGLGHHIDHMELGRDADRGLAEEHYRAALEREPGNHVVNYNLGVLVYWEFASRNSNEEALELFRRALSAPNERLRARANSAMANALLTRVHRFREGGAPDLEEALKLATEAVDLYANLDTVEKASGYAHHQLGEWLYAHADEEPDPQATRKLALTHLRRGREGYEKALELNPGHFVAANNLANLFLGWAAITKDPREKDHLLSRAAKAAESSLQTNPGYQHAHDNLGNIRLARGEYAEALEAFASALRFQPHYPEAKNDIALVYLDTRYAPAAADQVRSNHLAALLLTAPDSERQRQKLCRQLVDRAWDLSAGGNLVAGFEAGSGNSGCSCRQFWDAGAKG